MSHSRILLSVASLVLLLTFSCCVHEKPSRTDAPSKNANIAATEPLAYSIVSPTSDRKYTIGERIPIKLSYNESLPPADSIDVTIDGVLVGMIKSADYEGFAETKSISPGSKRLRINAFFSDGRTESISLTFKLVSDITPKNYTYRIMGTFPHDINAYTQGFEYHNGYFYEGTGQHGLSSIRKVIPGTGDIIKSRNLSSDLFGEGITLLNGKLYQLTYRSQVGFIYNPETFEQIQKFFYQNKEGWGLTNNGSELIMSDGTHFIYFVDPQYFTVIRKIEVYDTVSEIDSLNELEYINGTIYANRYMTNEIVMIDPLTGKLIGRADLNGLLTPKDRHPGIDVLNGIAWDKNQSRLFVTGKNWPKIYHIELIGK